MNDEKDLRPNAEPGASEDDTFVTEHVQAAGSPKGDPAAASSGQASLAGTIRQTIFRRPGSREQEPATEASGANLSAVNATTALLNQSGSESITAERVTMERSGARSIDARSVQMDQSGVVALSTENAVLLKSSAVQVVAEEARLSHSSALFLSSGKASIEHSRIAIFAGTAEGDVQPLITGRTVAIMSGALATFMVLLITVLQVRTRD